MEAWDRMKMEMTKRTGTESVKFKTFSNVLSVIISMKRLGMNPTLLVISRIISRIVWINLLCQS